MTRFSKNPTHRLRQVSNGTLRGEVHSDFQPSRYSQKVRRNQHHRYKNKYLSKQKTKVLYIDVYNYCSGYYTISGYYTSGGDCLQRTSIPHPLGNCSCKKKGLGSDELYYVACCRRNASRTQASALFHVLRSSCLRIPVKTKNKCSTELFLAKTP